MFERSKNNSVSSHRIVWFLLAIFGLTLGNFSYADSAQPTPQTASQTPDMSQVDKSASDQMEQAATQREWVDVEIVTNLGTIKLQLNQKKAPISVANFLEYANEAFYNQTTFHRVIPSFMIQGGGFLSGMRKKTTKAPIVNEAKNGLKNLRGTIAMARTRIANSATSQFFINTKNNPMLDHGARDYGYAVFGRVTQGMEVVDKIAAVPTSMQQGFQNVPKEPVLILEIKVLPQGQNDNGSGHR